MYTYIFVVGQQVLIWSSWLSLPLSTSACSVEKQMYTYMAALCWVTLSHWPFLCSLAPQDMKQNGLQPWLASKLEFLFVCFVGWWVWYQCLLLVMIGSFQKPHEQGLKVVLSMEHSCRSNRKIYRSKMYSFHPAFQKDPGNGPQLLCALIRFATLGYGNIMGPLVVGKALLRPQDIQLAILKYFTFIGFQKMVVSCWHLVTACSWIVDFPFEFYHAAWSKVVRNEPCVHTVNAKLEVLDAGTYGRWTVDAGLPCFLGRLAS